MFANAPIGAVHPPSNTRKNSRSILTQVAVSSSFSPLQASNTASFSHKQAIIIAP